MLVLCVIIAILLMKNYILPYYNFYMNNQESLETISTEEFEAVVTEVEIVEEITEEATDEIEDVYEPVEIELNGGYYYDLLTPLEQDLYKELVVTYFNYEASFILDEYYAELDSSSVFLVHKYVLLDYPEIFWINKLPSNVTSVTVDDVTKVESINGIINYTEDEIVQYQFELEDVLAEVKTLTADAENDYEIALAVYEYIILNCDYDMESADSIKAMEDYTMEMKESITLIGSLINGSAVCSGYAKGYTYLLNELGVEAFSVIGFAGDVGHEWNMVLLDGDYYHVDTTWGDPVYLVEETSTEVPSEISYNYFGLTIEAINATHTLDEEIEYPECTATSYNYYIYNNLYFNTYDFAVIEEIFDEAISEKQEEVVLVFSTYEVYENALTNLTEIDMPALIKDNIDVLNNAYGYSVDEEQHTIKIYLQYQ